MFLIILGSITGYQFDTPPITTSTATLVGLGVHASNLSPAQSAVQLDLWGVESRRQRMLALDKTIDELRFRYGNHAVRRLSELCDPRLSMLDPQRDNVVHPVSFFA